MAFFEFPHTRTYDSDLGWLIKTYNELLADYGSLKAWKTVHEKEYKELKTELDALIANMTSPVEPWDGTIAYKRYTLVEYNGDTYIALQDVPAGVLITDTSYWGQAQTIQAELNAIKSDVNDLEDEVDEALNVVDLLTADIVTIKAADETIDGYPYGGFCGGCVFQGHELYAFRVAPEHRTDENDFGHIVFYERLKTNEFVRFELELTYDPLTYGECRDPNLSVSRDGKRLYVSVFTSFNAGGSTHHSIVFVFNANFTQIGMSVIPNTIFWGNTVETPSGYLLHGEYSGSTLALYKSDQIVTDLNAPSITWTKLTPFTLTAGRTYAEPTLGYFNNKLVMITRTGGTYASEIAYTYNLEGDDGWGTNAGIGMNLHAPALVPYYEGNLLPCSGSIVDAAITGDASYRKPYFILLDFNNPTASTASYVSPVAKGLIAPNSQTPNFGGYTTLVQLHNDVYGIMYYGDTDTDNSVAFVEYDLYRSLLNMTYHTMTGARSDFVVYTTNVKNAYSKSIADWVIAALSEKNAGAIRFTSATSAADIADKPTGLQSNFAGYAYRASTQYYIEVFFFSGTTPVRAIKTGTSATLRSNSWTIT